MSTPRGATILQQDATSRPPSTASAVDGVQKIPDIDGGVAETTVGVSISPSPPLPVSESKPAPMRNLYTAAMSYNGFTITDGALRLIVLLHAADLGFNAIEIAFMFSMYEVSPYIHVLQ